VEWSWTLKLASSTRASRVRIHYPALKSESWTLSAEPPDTPPPPLSPLLSSWFEGGLFYKILLSEERKRKEFLSPFRLKETKIYKSSENKCGRESAKLMKPGGGGGTESMGQTSERPVSQKCSPLLGLFNTRTPHTLFFLLPGEFWV
jgi:hypothetical protein